MYCIIELYLIIIVKLLDWGEDGIATSGDTATLRASFQQEVAVWQQLDHPNVTKVSPHAVFPPLAFALILIF